MCSTSWPPPAASTCPRARQVAVTGRLRLNEWVNSDGERRSKLQVVADDVDFLDKAKVDNGLAAVEEVADRPAVGRYRNGNGNGNSKARAGSR